MTRNVSLNIRFELWSQQKDQRAHWIEWLAAKSRLARPFCRDLLLGRIEDEAITSSELDVIADALNVPDRGMGLRFDEPLVGTNVLKANLNFLFDRLEHGGKKSMALALNVAQTTISRWLAGDTSPGSPTLEAIVREFRLPAGTDLRTEPLFLSLDPVSLIDKHHWVRDRLDKLSEQELQDLYPALRRMLDDDR